MGTIFPAVGSNLTVAYFEEKMFAILPKIYPKDFVDFFICNYFQFLQDVQFIFEELTQNKLSWYKS